MQDLSEMPPALFVYKKNHKNLDKNQHTQKLAGNKSCSEDKVKNTTLKQTAKS